MYVKHRSSMAQFLTLSMQDLTKKNREAMVFQEQVVSDLDDMLRTLVDPNFHPER